MIFFKKNLKNNQATLDQTALQVSEVIYSLVTTILKAVSYSVFGLVS